MKILKLETGGLIALSQNQKDTQKQRKELENGYKKMAQINLELAKECIEADTDCFERYEQKLTECE